MFTKSGCGPRKFRILVLSVLISAVVICTACNTKAENEDIKDKLAWDKDTLFLLNFENKCEAQDRQGKCLGEISGEPVFMSDPIHGKSLQFDIKDSLVFPAEGHIDMRKGSIEMWISPDWNEPDTNWRWFFILQAGYKTVEGESVPYDSIRLYKTDYQQLRAAISDKNGNMYRAYRTELDWKPGEWHHVKMVWNIIQPLPNGSSIDLFIDGSNRGNTYYTRKIEFSSTPAKFTIGQNFKGMLSGVKINLSEGISRK